MVLDYFMISYCPTKLQNLAADQVLKNCKNYAKKNNITVKESIIVLLSSYPYQIQKIVKDRLEFYLKYSKK